MSKIEEIKVNPVTPIQQTSLDASIQPSSQDKGLPDIFKYDTAEQPQQMSQKKVNTPSFWSRISAWWSDSESNKPLATTPSQEADELSVQKIEALSPIPALDDHSQINHQSQFNFDPNQLDKLKTKEDFLNFISSIRDVMSKVLYLMREQLNLEDNQITIIDQKMKTLNRIEKSFNAALDQLKEDIEKEQTLTKSLGYIQDGLTVITAGLTLVGMYVPQLVGTPLVIAAGSNALTIATKGYVENKALGHKKEIDDISYKQTYTNQKKRDEIEQISLHFDNAMNIYTSMARILTFHYRMRNIMLQKN